MLFLVISTPAPNRPSSVARSRQRFWKWMDPMLKSGAAKSIYARPGRGAVVLFDVASHEALHALLNEWADLVPATFELYPLLDPGAAQGYLRSKAGAKARLRG